MLRPRVIPCLLLDGGRLVKTTRFKDPVYVGDPINAVKIFNDKEADELVLLDVGATRGGRGPNLELLARISREAFMPMAYGGGIRSLEQAREVSALGYEKVVVNAAAREDPALLGRLAAELGSQSVVASIDVVREGGRARAWDHARARPLDRDPLDLARALVAAGAGELLVTSVDREGSLSGYDLELVRQVAAAVDVPVVAQGGAGSLEHLRAAIEAGASAAAAGAMFVFHGRRRAVLITYPAPAALAGLLRSPS